MTRTVKAAAAATITLVSSIALMSLLRANVPDQTRMLEAMQAGNHPMGVMWSEMGWIMALGPIAMVLFFGAIATLIVLVVRSIFNS